MHLVQALDLIKTSLLRRLRVFRAKLGASPFFLRHVVLGQKENFHVRIGVDQQRRAGFQPSGEVKEIIVLAEAVEVIGAFSFSGSKQDERAAFHLLGQRHAASMIVSIVLALSCAGADAGGKGPQAYPQRLLRHTHSVFTDKRSEFYHETRSMLYSLRLWNIGFLAFKQ